MPYANFPSPTHGLYLKDDFYTNDASTDAAIGELKWELVAITADGTSVYAAPTDGTTFGVLHNTTDGTAAHGVAYRLDEDGITLGPKGGYFRFRCSFPDIAGNVLAGNCARIGLQNTVTATDSTVGIWVDMLAGVITMQGDSSHGDHTLTPTGIDTLTSGTTMVLGTMHDFFVRWYGENAQGGPAYAELFIDDVYAGKIPLDIDNDETMELSVTHWDTSAGGTLDLYIDFIELFVAR